MMITPLPPPHNKERKRNAIDRRTDWKSLFVRTYVEEYKRYWTYWYIPLIISHIICCSARSLAAVSAAAARRTPLRFLRSKRFWFPHTKYFCIPICTDLRRIYVSVRSVYVSFIARSFHSRIPNIQIWSRRALYYITAHTLARKHSI